ncbi:MAG: hypothetical protein BWY76_01780 [bacterium ADurb.Bin429]|nr:MAG: hypothetical protein BWY76_01780 [bacterium ADurb.Bin429]
MTDNLPPIVRPSVPPPPPMMTPVPSNRPGVVIFIAVTLLALAVIDVLALLPSNKDLVPASVSLVSNLDSALAVIIFLICGVGLLMMKAWARAWTIRLLALRFVALVGSLIYSVTMTANTPLNPSILVVSYVLSGFIFVFSAVMTIAFISLLRTEPVRAAFAARADNTDSV